MSAFVKVNQIAQTVESLSADPGEEFPFLHTITVVDRVVSVDKPELIQNNINTETVTLNLDSEWDGLSCLINIGNDDSPVSLIWSGQPVVIPAELMTDIGTLNVSVVGYGDDGAVRAVTKKADAMFVVAASGYVHDNNPVPDPTTILGQLTEAADRANQAAQNAEDSTIDKVDVTMLPTGSSASGSVADKTLSLSIPNGPQGPQGPKGDPGDLTTVAHDDTLTGDGTTAMPLGVVDGTALQARSARAVDLDTYETNGFYYLTGVCQNTPEGTVDANGILFVQRSGVDMFQVLITSWFDYVNRKIYYRTGNKNPTLTWSDWITVATTADIPDVSALTSRIATLESKLNELAVMQTRLQALGARVKSLETN